MFTDSLRRAVLHRGPLVVHHRAERVSHGLSKVGIPAAPQGLQAETVTIADLLKDQGYATGQFGKNHLGDLNKFLPTVHGFDEFFGNLYHLNAEEEPEMDNYPKDPKFRETFGPRGVIHSWATDKDDPTEEPRWGKVGKQKIEDTGPLTKKRMETCDDEFVAAAKDFIQRQHKADKPFFVWLNTTHMHLFTHTKPESLGQAGRWQSPYHDTMIDHDKNVGEMLDLLDELGIADNTFVMYSSDNGPHMNTWPDGAMTPFRSEKNTNWEGAFRVPLLVRWPGKIEAGSVSNGIVQHHDWLPTFLAMAGDTGVVGQAEEGRHRQRQEVQEPHRRLQPAALPDRRGEGEPAQVLLLLQRRRRRAGHPLRQLEAGLHGAALPGNHAAVGRAVHPAAIAEDLQPAHGSLRACGRHLEHVLGLVSAQHVLHLCGADGGGEVRGDLQGVPAGAEAGQLHHRRCDGEDERGRGVN